MSDFVPVTSTGSGPYAVSRIEIQPLGAGQDIGRSCIALKFLSRSNQVLAMVLLDCGLHVGFDDPNQAFPDFSRVNLRQVDAVLVTHYHIDHCGAIPLLVERAKYTGPVFVSPPTKALLPMMLEDQLSERGYSALEIRESVAKCSVLEARQTYTIKPGLEVTSYRAGHVLGAVIFHVKFGNASAIYTGDFNATPDRHLGSYEYCPVPPGCPPPDVIITESTYGSTTRGSQHSLEREFLDQVHSCLLKGGKVLIPSFAMGRVQEVVSLLQSHWERMNLHFPIFLCTKEAASVASVYDFYEGWGSSRVSPPEPPHLAFAGVPGSARSYLLLREPTIKEMEGPGAMVLLATSAMLVGGLSLRAFRMWASDDRNAVIFPGHCVRGTIGHNLLTAKEKAEKGEAVSLKLSTRTTMRDEVLVRCAVSTAPFSAHTDSKGILQLIHQVQPKHVVLVHGVKVQMEALKRRIERELPQLERRVFFPETLEVVSVQCLHDQTHAHQQNRRPQITLQVVRKRLKESAA